MKKINKKTAVIFVGIVLISIILRFWQLDSVPPSLDWDEASWGYNAYSILETGSDEYGKRLPIVIRSFNDYKPALYAYLTIPVIAVLGLTDFAVRFANALFGVFAVIVTYFLAKELFKRRDVALVSMFLMSISPWAIQFSRFAHEGMVGLVFNLLFALFFLKGLKKPVFLSFAAACAALSLYSYQNEKIFVPLFGLILLISFYKEFFSVSKKYLASAFLVGLIMSLPIIWFTFTTPEAFTRAKGASFLNNPIGVLNIENYPERLIEDRKTGNFVGLVIDNRRVLYAKAIIGNYLSHYDPNFLFVKGDATLRHQPHGMGHLYLIELPFLLIGLYFLFFGKFDRRVKIFIILLMLIVPIAASTTWDVPNAGRTMNFLPAFQIITALGIIGFYKFILGTNLHKTFKYGIFGGIILIASFNFVYFLNQYFSQYSYFASPDFQYGYNQIIPEVNKLYSNYDKIIVSNEVPLDQSYIFFLYNLKYPPSDYQKVSTFGEYQTNHSFDKFEFRRIKAKDYLKSDPSQLFISSPNDFPDEAKTNIIKNIKFFNGETSVLVVKGLEKSLSPDL